MKKIQWYGDLPDCDICAGTRPGCRNGKFDAPTRRDSEGRGKWANLCGAHFALMGIDTSVTSERVQDASRR